MTIGEKIKSLRNEKGITQEALAEELNVSRSAIAKWESNNGIPEISNLKSISQIFNVSLDELLDNEVTAIALESKQEIIQSEYAGWYCTINLTGWNDGVSKALVLSEDENFLLYQKQEKKKTVYGMIGKKHITTVERHTQNPEIPDNIDRNYFCGKNVFVEIACKEGLIKGFFDFKSDDYRDVTIKAFEKTKIILSLGRKLDINNITKIEEL
ncbi:MAG: helix-turn-helix transcriptional regulator [Lachnospiraceae bacterium]|nr:helix-turn-helix transcriptional regulator [Lachnospiraceae bacterium]